MWIKDYGEDTPATIFHQNPFSSLEDYGVTHGHMNGWTDKPEIRPTVA